MNSNREHAIEIFDQEAEEYDGLVKQGTDWNGQDVVAGDLIFIADEDVDQMAELDEEAHVVGFYEQAPGVFSNGGLKVVLKMEGLDTFSVSAGIIERAADQG